MRVRIYHSIDHEFMFREWRPEAPLKLVDEYQIQGWREGEHPESQPAPGIRRMAYRESVEPELILEVIYRDQNAVDGSERNVQMSNRSLSVGDVVMLNDYAFAVQSAGFVEIAVNQMKVEVAR